jgi:flagellar biosynthesis/type III secretory pathway ATPase
VGKAFFGWLRDIQKRLINVIGLIGERREVREFIEKDLEEEE